jgi:hypothetical protein
MSRPENQVMAAPLRPDGNISAAGSPRAGHPGACSRIEIRLVESSLVAASLPSWVVYFRISLKIPDLPRAPRALASLIIWQQNTRTARGALGVSKLREMPR